MKIKTARKYPIMDKLTSKEEGARIEEITTAITVEESLEDLTRSLEDLTIGEEVPVEDSTEKKEVPVVKVKEATATKDNPVLNPTTVAKQEISQEKN